MLQCMLMYYDHRLMISRLIVYALATLPKIVAENGGKCLTAACLTSATIFATFVLALKFPTLVALMPKSCNVWWRIPYRYANSRKSVQHCWLWNSNT